MNSQLKAFYEELPNATDVRLMETSDRIVPECLLEQSDRDDQLERFGFAVGVLVREKADKVQRSYCINDVTDDGIVLTPRGEGHCLLGALCVDHAKLLEEWSVFKGEIAAPLHGFDWDGNRCSPMQSKSWDSDFAKSVCVIVQ